MRFPTSRITPPKLLNFLLGCEESLANPFQLLLLNIVNKIAKIMRSPIRIKE
uniref:Uncharacterized protein n=1 Tax=Arundo donax TaxID=35708 RepID=A0A0A8XYV3_ARUDO